MTAVGHSLQVRPRPLVHKCPLCINTDRKFWALGFVAMVELRMGAVAWAMRQRSVSHPRSSNRTCPIKASGSPTGFIVRHTGSKPLTARGFCTVSTLLRPSTQQSRTAPVFDGVLRLIANHHDLAIFESTPEVRALSSAGITRLQRSYDPVRLPPWPSPEATLRPLPSPVTGLPRLPEPPFRRAVPTTPADRAGARVDCFPAHAAFPKWQEGRHPHCHFRGLLRLHSRYGPSDCSAA